MDVVKTSVFDKDLETWEIDSNSFLLVMYFRSFTKSGASSVDGGEKRYVFRSRRIVNLR